jgi:hypothetical protein
MHPLSVHYKGITKRSYASIFGWPDFNTVGQRACFIPAQRSESGLKDEQDFVEAQASCKSQHPDSDNHNSNTLIINNNTNIKFLLQWQYLKTT